MNGVLLEIFNMVLVAMEVFILMVLAGGFFVSKVNRRQYLLRCIMVYVITYAILIVATNYVALRLILNCLAFACLLKIIYQTSIIKTLLVAILYLSVIYIVDTTILYLAALISGFDMAEFLKTPYSYYLMAYFAKITELFLVAVIRVWAKSRFQSRSTNSSSYLRFCIFPAMSLVVSAILVNAFVSYPEAVPQLLLCVVILLASDVAAIVLLDQFDEQQQVLVEQRILQQELKSAQANITSLSASYFHERKLTHDFKNRLLAIQGLLKRDDTAHEAQEYIDQVLNSQYELSLSITTNRTVFDIILNQKYLVATQKGIPLRLQLDDMSAFPLPDDALVVVLANLIDNAIEASEQIEDVSGREIVVKTHVTEFESILCVENPVSQHVEIQNGKIKTSKKDSNRHGFGLNNAQAIIRKYNGAFAMKCADLRFSVVVHFLHDECAKK